MPAPERIKHFIQSTLGCGCPEEVFRSIDVRRKVRLNSFIVLDSAIIIGNRLLVYTVEACTEASIEEQLPTLVGSGEKERDEKGLNRFRLVLTVDDPEAVRKTAEKLFDDLRVMDEKVHLHVIKKSDILFTAEDTEEKDEGKRVRS